MSVLLVFDSTTSPAALLKLEEDLEELDELESSELESSELSEESVELVVSFEIVIFAPTPEPSDNAPEKEKANMARTIKIRINNEIDLMPIFI